MFRMPGPMQALLLGAAELQQAKVRLVALGMAPAQVEEAARLLAVRPRPIMGLLYLAACLEAGEPVDEVMVLARKLWGEWRLEAPVQVEAAMLNLRKLGMTQEQAEEAAKLAFEGATHTTRSNLEVTLSNMEFLHDPLTKGQPPEEVLALARKLWGGVPQ